MGKEVAVPCDLGMSQLLSQHTHTRAREKGPAEESKSRLSIGDLHHTGKTHWLVDCLCFWGWGRVAAPTAVVSLTALGARGSAGTLNIHTLNPGTQQSPRGESSSAAAPGMDGQCSHPHSSGEHLTGKLNGGDSEFPVKMCFLSVTGEGIAKDVVNRLLCEGPMP